MAINMTKEQVAESQTTLINSPWEITDKVREEIAKAKVAIEKSGKGFEGLVISCPTDGSNSKFVRYEGSYTRGWAIFRCENGHEFQQG